MKRELIVELPNGDFRKATGSEAKAAKKAEAERLELETELEAIEDKLRELSNGCPHLVCQDKLGFSYNIRCCLRCGHQSLL